MQCAATSRIEILKSGEQVDVRGDSRDQIVIVLANCALKRQFGSSAYNLLWLQFSSALCVQCALATPL